MRFPYRESVGSNLRDLFGADRLRAQSRNLGSSSITQGEGSLELRTTDSGGTVMHLGDLPGGGFGIGVPNGAGGWRTVQDDAQARANAAQAAAEASAAAATSALAGRVGTAEGRLDSHATRLGSAEGRLTSAESMNSTQNGRLDSHASRLGATENDVAAMQSTIAAQAGTIAGQSALIAQLRADHNALAAWVRYPGDG